MIVQHGQLQADPGVPPVPGQIDLTGRRVDIAHERGKCSWPVSAVSAGLWDGPTFEFRIGERRLTFLSEDPIAFIFDFLPALEAAKRARTPRRLRQTSPTNASEFWMGLTEGAVDRGPALRPSEPPDTGEAERPRDPASVADEPALDPWTEVALGTARNDVIRMLERLEVAEPALGAPRTTHAHGRSGRAGICPECRDILIDLTRLEAETE